MTGLRAAWIGLGIAVCLSALSADTTKDWPCYRGPKQDSISSEPLSTHWPEGGPKRLWSAKLMFGYSSLAISGTRGYTLGSSGSGSETWVYSLNIDTGAEIWKTKLPRGVEKSYHSYGSLSTPALDDKRLYVVDPQGMAAGLDVESGKVLWSFDSVEHGIAKNHYGFGGSPLLYKELVILNSGYALKAATGEVAWQDKKLTSPYFSTPFLFTQNGVDTVILTGFPTGKSRLVGVNPLSGDETWNFEFTKWPHGNWQGVSDLLRIGENQIFFGNGALLKLENNALTVSNEKLPYSNTYLGNPVYWQGHVFGFSSIRGDPPQQADLDASRLQCLDLTSGKLDWVQRGIAGTCSIADGKLLIMTCDGQLIVAEASPAAYKEIVRTRVYESNMKGKGMNGRDGAWVMPILVNGRIYCRDLRGATSEIVCLDVSHLDK
jgi:outer membrane protein assembly factor BamB